MVNLLLIILLASLYVFDWLFFVMGIGGRIMTWIPEIVAILIAVSIPFRTAMAKEMGIPLKYGILIFLYLANILGGFLLNDISGWTVLAGLRVYIKFIPIFLVPMIYPLTAKAFRNIILWVYALSMLQLPVVIWQRFFLYAASRSGDPMGGTLGVSASGVLAIYLISILSFLVAFYYKDQISMPFFLISAAAAFIPITMNETKVSFVLLPIAFIFPAIFIKQKRQSIFKIFLTILIFIAAFTVFKVSYDFFAKRGRGFTVEQLLTLEGRLERTIEWRVKSLETALSPVALKDMRFAFFGHGAGNVSEGFTQVLSGKYVQQRWMYDVETTLVKMIWELGLLGTLIFLGFPLLLFLDARRLCREPGIPGAFGLGMLSYITFFVFSTIYTFTIDSNILIFLFFLLSGQLASLRAGLDRSGDNSPLRVRSGQVQYQ